MSWFVVGFSFFGFVSINKTKPKRFIPTAAERKAKLRRAKRDGPTSRAVTVLYQHGLKITRQNAWRSQLEQNFHDTLRRLDLGETRNFENCMGRGCPSLKMTPVRRDAKSRRDTVRLVFTS